MKAAWVRPARLLTTRTAPQRHVGCRTLSSSSSEQAELSHPLLSSLLSGYLAPYWEVTPSAGAAIAGLEAWLPEATVAFDHFAFRTFGTRGLGISSIGTWFVDLGYVESPDYLEFPKKKLRAKWYSPPSEALPRIFVSELKVEEMSQQTQRLIAKYASGSGLASTVLGRYGPVTGLLGCMPWGPVDRADYETLAAESEYAAWVLLNGYALNHTTVSVHRLQGLQGGIEAVNTHLQAEGLVFNEEGGVTKVSPDGLLLQSSTVADSVEFAFADGSVVLVPGSYIEFAERLVLPEYASLPEDEISERHRRDGFEVSSADKIFESTTVAAQRLADRKE